MNATRTVLRGLLLLWLSTSWSRGELVQADDSRFGVGSLTIDTSTGLAWLDVPITRGMSFNDVVAQTGPGGPFEGFRYATAEEIGILFHSAGIVNVDVVFPPPTDRQPALNLISLVGATLFDSGYVGTMGISSTFATNVGATDRRLMPTLWICCSPVTYDPRVFLSGTTGDSQRADFAGSWLVTQVPEPSSIALLFLGTGALALVRHAIFRDGGKLNGSISGGNAPCNRETSSGWRKTTKMTSCPG